ncbi:MAG TPA: putative toxin-antitoxin system toxin component, PIN family [Armatimonadota bacterium]|jgi:putative PIN family toxin of toxin-antitoxin system
MNTPPVIVPDTNLILAAHWNPRSASHQLLEAAEAGRVTLAMSEDLAAEIRHLLSTIHARSEYVAWIEALLREATWVEPWVRLEGVVEDPDDDKLLECALAAEADYVVTSDDHLLRLGQFAGVRIVKPRAALQAVDPRNAG